MPEELTREQLLEMFERDVGPGSIEMTDREMACSILPSLDYEKQLVAISSLLNRNHEAKKRLHARMKETDEFARSSTGLANERAIDECGQDLYLSIYQNAAHSMAALGMIAPLLESMMHLLGRLRGSVQHLGQPDPERQKPGITNRAVRATPAQPSNHRQYALPDRTILSKLVISTNPKATPVYRNTR
jgi:hypothetical protein